jgi:hypothetical protein
LAGYNEKENTNMTEALNWSELTNTRVGEVEPPKGIPDGHYGALITGIGNVENKGQKKTLCITFPLKLTEALEDVDREEFAASDGFRDSGYELQFWITPASLYRFTEFGKGMGASDEMSIPEMAEYLATCGEQLVVEVRNEPSQKDPSRSFMRIDNPVPLSAYQA